MGDWAVEYAVRYPEEVIQSVFLFGHREVLFELGWTVETFGRNAFIVELDHPERGTHGENFIGVMFSGTEETTWITPDQIDSIG